MKIAIIAGTFFPYAGGVQVETHNMANKLVKKGNKVDVYVFTKPKLSNNLYNIIKLNYFYLSFLYILKYFINFPLKIVFKSFKFNFIDLEYEIYHFHFLNFKSLILVEFLKFFKKKVIVTFHGADIQIKKKINYGFRINNKYNNYLEQIVKEVDAFQCISKNIYKDLIKLNIKRKKIRNIPNSIELNKFKSNSKSNNITKSLNLITVGRYAKYKKGFDLLPFLGKKLISHKIKFKWFIIGDNTKQIYEDEFLKKNCKFFIPIANIENINERYFPPKKLIKYYSSSHLYINLARIESFGLTFIEALASKVPIISFKTKGANEILINKKNGFFVKNLNEIVMLLSKIQKFPKEYKKVKKGTYNSIIKFSLDQNVYKILNLYKEFKN